MIWHPNSSKHKANHRGYKSRPSKKQVIALLDFYNVKNVVAKTRAARQEEGIQLKLEL